MMLDEQDGVQEVTKIRETSSLAGPTGDVLSQMMHKVQEIYLDTVIPMILGAKPFELTNVKTNARDPSIPLGLHVFIHSQIIAKKPFRRWLVQHKYPESAVAWISVGREFSNSIRANMTGLYDKLERELKIDTPGKLREIDLRVFFYLEPYQLAGQMAVWVVPGEPDLKKAPPDPSMN